jgi:diguanylate cyclase (GGDEF)-like protein
MNFQSGGESGTLLKTRKQAVMAVRLLILLILGLTVRYRGSTGADTGQLLLLLGLFAASNVVFWFVHRNRFESRRSYSLILVFDVGLVSLLMALQGQRYPEFFGAFFLTVLAAVFAGRVSAAVMLSVAAAAAFAVLHGASAGAGSLLTQEFFMRINVLFGTGLLAGYIAEGMEAERQIAIRCNPTTGLPGYALIRAEIERRIKSGAKFAVCYIDNDNFKAYNDHYGYARGDRLIQATGETIVGVVQRTGGRDDFTGHVGGDDFLVITTPGHVDEIAFEVNALQQGFIKSHDRKGITAIFPVMSLSIAVVSNANRDIRSADEIAEIAAQLKKKAKSHKSRMYVTGDTTAMRTRREMESRGGGQTGS